MREEIKLKGTFLKKGKNGMMRIMRLNELEMMEKEFEMIVKRNC